MTDSLWFKRTAAYVSRRSCRLRALPIAIVWRLNCLENLSKPWVRTNIRAVADVINVGERLGRVVWNVISVATLLDLDVVLQWKVHI